MRISLAVPAAILILYGIAPRVGAASTTVESLRDATVNIGYVEPAGADPKGDTKTTSLGAGVIFRLKGAPKDTVYLVTAKHVFVNSRTSEIGLRFAWFQDDAKGVHKQILTSLTKDNQPVWKSIDGIDLACLPMTLSPSLIGRDVVPTVSETDLAGPDDMYVGAPILVFGYPDVVGSWDTAICRQGIIAALKLVDAVDNPFLIDCNIFPGNSGGPVLKSTMGLGRDGKGSMRLRGAILGIVSRSGQRREAVFAGSKEMTTPTDAGAQPVQAEVKTAIGVVEPASRIRRLLQLFNNEG